MKIKIKWLAATCLALLLLQLPAPAAEADATAKKPRYEAMKQSIMAKVAVLRGLAFDEEVPLHVTTSREVGLYIRKTLDKDMDKDEFEGLERLLVYLGYMEPGFDLKDALIQAYSGNIAGYYDDEEKAFYVVADTSVVSLDKETVSHELTHALQDQHFDLNAMRERTKGNDDAELAAMALCEGDAVDIMMRYSTSDSPRGKGGPKDYSGGLFASLGSQSIPNLPMLLVQDMYFPYTYGPRFVAELMKRKGDDAVNEAFKNPPVSTEQIMNPDKYFQNDDPRVIELPDLSASLGEGWRMVKPSPLGQFNLGLYLSSSVGNWQVDETIAPWAGDVLAVYIGPASEDVAIVYYSTWDNAEGAEKFADLYRRLIETRFPKAEKFFAKDGRTIWLKDNKVFYLRQTDNDVISIENMPRGAAADFIVKGWDKARKIPYDTAVAEARARAAAEKAQAKKESKDAHDREKDGK